MTSDPLYTGSAVIAPSLWNRYGYVLGDPINFTDPHGLECTWHPQTNTLTCPVPDFPSPGGGGGGGTKTSDPKEALTFPGARALAQSLLAYVKAGHINDCEAVAGFAGALGDAAAITGEQNYDIAAAFAVLVPISAVPSAFDSVVSGSTPADTVYLGNTASQKTG